MKLGFRSKVLLAITAITICSSISIALIYLNRSRQEIESNAVKTLWQSMSVSLSAFDENMRKTYDTAVSLRYDEKLATLAADCRADEVSSALPLTSYLQDWQRGLDNVKNIYVYLPSLGQAVTSENYHATQVAPADSVMWQTNNGLSPRLLRDEVDRAGGYILSYGGASKPGYVSVNLDAIRLFYQYFDKSGDSRTDSYYLVDGQGTIILAASPQNIGQPFSDVTGFSAPLGKGKRFATADGQERLIAAMRSSFTGFTLVSITDQLTLTTSLRTQSIYIIGFLFAVLILMLLPAYHMSGRVYAPVRKLREAMQKVSEGDLSARADILTNDEIGQLAEGFNNMIEQIDELIGDLVNEKIQKRDAELEALQYQITPHFMYNTLNSIKYAAVLQGNPQIGEQLSAFIELLQASIRRNGAFITVRDEIRMVTNYVKLQKFRYPCGLTVDYDLSPLAEPCFVPRLILQPLVENAILHGQAVDGECHITITTALAADLLILSVQDSGAGMTQQQITSLLNTPDKSRSHFSGIGIPNIIERLHLYYGSQADLKYTSSKDGTKAVIILPASTDASAYQI